VTSAEAGHPSQTIYITLGSVPKELCSQPLLSNEMGSVNESELLLHLPHIASYYIAQGKYITVAPDKSANWEEMLLHLYSNGFAAILYQRNIIPYHVSGIFVNATQVLLFAAPSGTGKSTIALMLRQQGYPTFTDDTAILSVNGTSCWAKASYPMIRLWQQTFEQQSQFIEGDKQRVFSDLDKYGFSFHEQFKHTDAEVVGIVFLETAGTTIHIEALSKSACMQLLGQNIYRVEWINALKKQKLKFEQITQLAAVLPAWKATRPEHIATFDSFTSAIESEIIKPLVKNL
jgi:DNA-dependent RNA polymerase auxiliary subunit epsilon